MARVFLGWDERLRRQVAVKILHAAYAETDVGLRFQWEARTSAGLSHPNIVPVYDASETEFEGHVVSYIVMEYLPGGDLYARIAKRGRFPQEEVAQIGAQVAAGLAYAHKQGVTHRDVKPHNILMDRHGSLKLTDFGIARASDAAEATETGTFLGSARYASPEQLRGETITPASDMYSLGVTLYQAVVGRLPFEGAPLEVAYSHVSEKPLPPKKRALVSSKLDALILRCLEKCPSQRPTSMAQLEWDLRSLATESARTSDLATYTEVVTSALPSGHNDGAKPTGMIPSRRAGSRKQRLLAGVAGVLLAALVSGVGASAVLRGEEGESIQDAGSRSPAEQAQPVPASDAQHANHESSSQGPVQQAQLAPADDLRLAGYEPPADDNPILKTKPAPITSEGLTEQAAAQAVVKMYEAAAAGDYDQSWNLLSSGFQEKTAGSKERWAATFYTLEDIEFIEGPSARVSGDTATVTFVDRAHHTNRTEKNKATWRLVNEGGQWKLDQLLDIQRMTA
jgi:serine/threonine-protein kinase